MKKAIALLSVIFLFVSSTGAQYFQGSFAKDVSDLANLKIVFKMRPTAGITTGISYVEVAFRYPTVSTPTFTITNVTSNPIFTGPGFQRLPDYVAGGYTYVRFVFNTATIQSTAYTAGTEYTLFTITTPLPISVVTQFEMISNLALGEYVFGVVNEAGNLIDPGAGPQLYGPRFRIEGNNHILPADIPMPVKFSSFNATKKEKNVFLTWTVESQDVNSSHFEIERSADGTGFSKIETININVSNGPTATYSFTDVNIATGKSPAFILYRIKQIDKDNKFVYSEIRSLKMGGTGLALTLYPNPALHTATLMFNLPTDATVTISVIDASSKTVQKMDIVSSQGINRQVLNLSKLPTGTYQFVLRTNKTVETVRLVKSIL